MLDLSQKTLDALSEHGDIWCLDVEALPKFVANGERTRTPRIPKVSGSIAVIPIQGVITKRGGWFSDGMDRVSRSLDTAMSSKSISGVVLDVDSPGGSSAGLMEFADKIHSFRENPKPLLAVANTLAASAAFWAGSSADQLIVSPSGEVGSVGVWSLHLDFSKALEDIGIKPTFVFAGKHKIEGNPFEPLSDEAREEIQRGVDEVYDDFISALARNRGVTKAQVRSGFGEGRVFSAQRAKTAGMVDRIASMEEVLSSMAGDSESRGRRTELEFAEQQIQAAWKGEPVEEAGIHMETRRLRRARQRREKVKA